MAEPRIDPFIVNKFSIKIDGYGDVGSVQEISGVASESEVVELMQSVQGGKQVRIKTLGAQRYKSGKITLKYGSFKGDQLYKWWETVKDGKMTEARKNILITIHTSDGGMGFSINLTNCFPSSYGLSAFNTKTNEAISTTVDIEYEQSEIVLL
jgi:phage tail-like protein